MTAVLDHLHVDMVRHAIGISIPFAIVAGSSDWGFSGAYLSAGGKALNSVDVANDKVVSVSAPNGDASTAIGIRTHLAYFSVYR